MLPMEDFVEGRTQPHPVPKYQTRANSEQQLLLWILCAALGNACIAFCLIPCHKPLKICQFSAFFSNINGNGCFLRPVSGLGTGIASKILGVARTSVGVRDPLPVYRKPARNILLSFANIRSQELIAGSCFVNTSFLWRNAGRQKCHSRKCGQYSHNSHLKVESFKKTLTKKRVRCKGVFAARQIPTVRIGVLHILRRSKPRPKSAVLPILG